MIVLAPSQLKTLSNFKSRGWHHRPQIPMDTEVMVAWLNSAYPNQGHTTELSPIHCWQVRMQAQDSQTHWFSKKPKRSRFYVKYPFICEQLILRCSNTTWTKKDFFCGLHFLSDSNFFWSLMTAQVVPSDCGSKSSGSCLHINALFMVFLVQESSKSSHSLHGEFWNVSALCSRPSV